MKKRVKITEVDEDNGIIHQLMKEIPLKTRIKVDVQSYFINKNGESFFINIDKNSNEDEEQIAKNENIKRMSTINR